MKYSVLILGASYGSLFGTKLLMAGHRVTLVCTRPTAELINREGTRGALPDQGPGVAARGRFRRPCRARFRRARPRRSTPAQYDLVVLGMQEAQYGAPGVRELMGRIARSRKPCLAIMNMPPLPYLKRIPGLVDGDLWRPAMPIPRSGTASSPD